MSQHIITANRLRDGVPVWRAADGAWAELIEHAALHDTETMNEALDAARRDIGRRLVVGVYPVEVAVRDGRPVPHAVREMIRARGPSVRPDLGIQAKAAA